MKQILQTAGVAPGTYLPP